MNRTNRWKPFTKGKVDLKWIKDKIVKSYHGMTEDNERELIVDQSISNYGYVGYVFFALNGSPPKGCAIYSPAHKWLLVVDAWGNKHRKFNDIVVEGFERSIE